MKNKQLQSLTRRALGTVAVLGAAAAMVTVVLRKQKKA